MGGQVWPSGAEHEKSNIIRATIEWQRTNGQDNVGMWNVTSWHIWKKCGNDIIMRSLVWIVWSAWMQYEQMWNTNVTRPFNNCEQCASFTFPLVRFIFQFHIWRFVSNFNVSLHGRLSHFNVSLSMYPILALHLQSLWLLHPSVQPMHYLTQHGISNCFAMQS